MEAELSFGAPAGASDEQLPITEPEYSDEEDDEEVDASQPSSSSTVHAKPLKAPPPHAGASATADSSAGDDLANEISSMMLSTSQDHSLPTSDASPEKDPSVAERRKRLALKHAKWQKYRHEHNKDPHWYKHKKHVVICTWAGRPVYTRYGDDTRMAAYMGVISAIISNFQNIGNDNVRCIIAGRYKFVFLLRGPIYLVSISRTSESVAQLVQQLSFVHWQILAVLTGNVHQILESRPQYDIRNLMGGTENLLTDLISESNSDPSYLLNSVSCVRLNKSTRVKIGAVIRKARPKSLMYAVLLAGGRVVNMVQNKEHLMATPDLLLLINFVTNSESLRQSESWTPICLPNFNDQGYLYAYVSYLSADVCLTLVTSSPEDFFEMKNCRAKVVDGFEKNKCLVELKEALRPEKQHIRVEDLDTGVPEFRHFLYKLTPAEQHIQASQSPPYGSRKAAKELFRRYQRIHARVNKGSEATRASSSSSTSSSKAHMIYYEVCKEVTMLAWFKPGEYELYATFTPLVTKEAATAARNRIMQWVRREEDSLFITSSTLF